MFSSFKDSPIGAYFAVLQFKTTILYLFEITIFASYFIYYMVVHVQS